MFGFIPVSSGGASCGSAFVESRDAYVSDLTDAMTGFGDGEAQEDCSSLRSVMRIPAVALLVVGAALSLAGLIVGDRHKMNGTATETEQATKDGTA